MNIEPMITDDFILKELYRLMSESIFVEVNDRQRVYYGLIYNINILESSMTKTSNDSLNDLEFCLSVSDLHGCLVANNCYRLGNTSIDGNIITIKE